MAISATIAAVAVSAGSAASQHRQQRKAARSQRQARDLEQRKSDISRARENAKAIAAQQAALASQEAQGSASGIGSSSVLSGAQGSVQSTTAGNIGFADQINRLVQGQNAAIQSAANSRQTAANIGAGASIFNSALGAASASGAFSGRATSSGTNLQGQSKPLYNNTAFVKNF